jgi:hypothetical protein
VRQQHNDNSRWVSGRTVEEARAKAAAKYPEVDPAAISLEQGPWRRETVTV